jgi:cytochrome c oxidase cbb3-type subunit II
MNRMPLLFAGFFFTFASAWVGLVLLPWSQFGNLTPVANPDEVNAKAGQEIVPPALPGLAAAGERIYAAEGCVYCHSQQVRPGNQGSDMERGWGQRPSAPRDYIRRRIAYLGTMRTGPDLTNAGLRYPDPAWHHKHLYAPRSVANWSTMPAFRYLYEVRPIQGQRSPEALDLAPGDAPPPGYEVVPTENARALVAYLISLRQDYSLPEVKIE